MRLQTLFLRIKMGLVSLVYLAGYAISQMVVFFRGTEPITPFLGIMLFKQAPLHDPVPRSCRGAYKQASLHQSRSAGLSRPNNRWEVQQLQPPMGSLDQRVLYRWSGVAVFARATTDSGVQREVVVSTP